MSDDKGCQGYANYPTWAMSLWLDSGEYPKVTPADQLKDWMEENMPELGSGVWADLLDYAWEQIDWREIAENYLEEVADEF